MSEPFNRSRAAALFISAVCLLALALSFFVRPGPAASAPQDVTVRITETGFDPPLSSIAAGEAVTFVNDTDQPLTLTDSTTSLTYLPVSLGARPTAIAGPTAIGGATATGAPAAATFSRLIPPGGSYKMLFPQTGDFPLFIVELPSLHIWITVLLPPGGQVRGLLYADLRRFDDNVQADDDLGRIHLPDITVILRTPADVEVERVRTDLSGRFSFPHQRAGTYKLCWEGAGFSAACHGAPLVISSQSVHVGELVVQIAKSSSHAAVYGRARFADHSLPRYFEPYANVNAFTTLQLLDGGAAVAKVYVNNSGHYLIPNAPVQKNLTIEATNENGLDEYSLVAGALLPAHAFHMDLRLLNHRPLIEHVSATQAGEYARAADPGTTVALDVAATDPDGDPLSYYWLLPTFAGSLSANTGANVTWTLPAVEAVYRVEIIAYDGRGGYAKSSISVDANADGVLFAGRVVTPGNAPIAGALVDVNGETATTNAAGYVSLRAPQADVYILDISAGGYAPLSRIYTDGQTGGVWTLTPAEVVTVDPTQPIDVQDEQPVCPGAPSQRIPWDKYPIQAAPHYQNENGEPVSVGAAGVDFADLTANTTYIVGNSFVDSDVPMTVDLFTLLNGQTTEGGNARVDDNQAAGGSGLDLALNNVNIEFDLDRSVSVLTVQYGYFGGNVNLRINDALGNEADFLALNGQTLGGVTVAVSQPAGQPLGSLTLTGKIDRVAIGGQELWIDDVLFDPISRLPRDLPCPPGLRVQIPANALQDEAGNPPPGLVEVAVGTYDILAPDGMPGDYTVAGAPGDQLGMESFGAGSVQITDGTNVYNLKPGQTATLTMPVAPIHALFDRPIPPTIPNLLYNRATGEWEEVGQWTLSGDVYVTQVSHLSEFNSDLVSTDPACIRIASNTLPATYRLEVTIPRGPNAAPKVLSGTIDNSVPFHTVYRLPTNTMITLVVIHATQDVPIGTFVVSSGGVKDDPTELRPDYPYNDCQAEVVLYDPELEDPPSLSQSPANSFLHGLTSFFATTFDEFTGSTPANGATGVAFATATADYYEQIDPHHRRETLAEFIAANDFTTETHAIYANSADLGFGRDMHCARHEVSPGVFDVACYVSNYGNGYNDLTDGGGGGPGTPDTTDFQQVADQHDGNAANNVNPVATVAMEYSRVEDPLDPNLFISATRIVKFYVYGANGARVDGTNPAVVNGAGAVATNNAFVELDGFGGRPLPQLCMVCHGGSANFSGLPSATNPPLFNSSGDADLGSVFLPFDLNSFTIVDGYLPAFNKAAQQAEFRDLNQLFVDVTNPGAPIREVIDYMYPPVGGPGAGDQDQVFTVDGWDDEAAHADMYDTVMTPACRACHVAQVNAIGPTFQTAAQAVALAPQILQKVCVQGVMPHARATYDRFWKSINPHQPARLVAWGETYAAPLAWEECATAGPDDAPPIPDVVFHNTDIQPIWNSSCAFSGCHGGGAPAAGMDLTAANAYGEIVNVPSSELGTMDRIDPFNENLSYIWHKINGTQGGVGGSGSAMPPPSGGLGASQLATILQWIEDGAAEAP